MIEGLTGKTRELADYMSELSEEAYSAAWMDGLEYALWYAVEHGPRRYGRLDITKQHIITLKEFSAAIGGWVFFDEESEETYVSIEHWAKKYSENIQSYERKIS